MAAAAVVVAPSTTHPYRGIESVPGISTLSGDLQKLVKGKVLTEGEDFQRAANGFENVDYLGIAEPAMVLQPSSAKDVTAAVKFAAEKGLPVAARCSSHSISGCWRAQNGITIDMRALALENPVKINLESQTATVSGGALYSEILDASTKHDLLLPWGSAVITGMGTALHGGIGLSCRPFGLTADNIISARLVTADGKLVEASASDNPDLLSGIRGAGAAFGIVTELEFKLHPCTNYFGGSKVFIDESGTALRQVSEWAKESLAENPNLGAQIIGVANPDSGARVLQFIASYPGSNKTEAEKAAVFEPLSKIKRPCVQDSLGKMSYAEVEMIVTNAALGSKAKMGQFSLYGVSGVLTLDKMNEGFYEALVDGMENIPKEMSILTQIDFMGGAAKTTKSFTPFAGMDVHFLVLYQWKEGAIPDATAVLIAEQKRDALAKHTDHMQAYINASTVFDGSFLEGQVGGADNLAKLRALKQKYDPSGFFQTHALVGL